MSFYFFLLGFGNCLHFILLCLHFLQKCRWDVQQTSNTQMHTLQDHYMKLKAVIGEKYSEQQFFKQNNLHPDTELTWHSQQSINSCKCELCQKKSL